MDDAKTWRMFVAIAVPPVLKKALQEMQQEVQHVVPRNSAAWTKPDNLHLTLRFLGDVGLSHLKELQERLKSAVAGFGSIDLRCERLGCFPDLRFPRVVWAWVHDERERLPRLVQQLNDATAPFAERPADAQFVGHITLARPRQIRRPDARVLAQFVESAVSRQFGCWSATEIELILSELSSGGSRYTTVANFPLT